MKTVEPPVIPAGARIYPLSVEAYHLLGEAGWLPKSTELLYGIVYNKVSKSPYHSKGVRGLFERLHELLPAGCFLMSEQPITCLDSEPEPDVALVRGKPDDFGRTHPTTAELVMEVCITSHAYDRSKLRAYASAEVKEVWLLLAPEKQVEVYRQPLGGAYVDKKTYGPGGQLASAVLPEFVLDLNKFFKE